ncbi:MAG: Asp-tRNA(Asn)/Glu-tRNA(Gln) amidotransferase subunit GatA [Bacteroidota bacterium]
MKDYKQIEDIQKALKAGETTCFALVEYYLGNIQSKNAELNAFIEIYNTEAVSLAKSADIEIAAGNMKRLTGCIIGIKDLLCYKNHQSTGGSKILKGFKSLYTATAVQRLIDEGAIIIGRQNCDEFGMGSANENSAYGSAKNPVDIKKVSGGSSGGSAVAVKAGMCHVSIGTDTGGSVRQPAGFCGVVGFKPTYSRVSRWGLKAYASSFDTIGPITKSVEDAALITEIMAGYDENDATSSTIKVTNLSENLPSKSIFKIAYFKDAIENEGLNSEVKEATINKIEALKVQGHEVEAIDFPLMKHFLPTYYILTTAEASSNLSRYDGVRYGHRTNDAKDLITLYKKSRSEGFGIEVKNRIMLGTFVLSASYYDAYYTKAQKVRRLIKEETDKIFENYDFLIFPTAPTTAFELGKKLENPIEEYLADLYTVQANVVGNPAISIPNGEDKAGLPIGFQIMAGSFEEGKLFGFAKSLTK